MEFWKDKEKGYVNPGLFSELAEEQAGIWKKTQGEKDRNKFTQVRKFYDEVVRLADDVHLAKERWPLVEPQVHMLVAKAAYAQGRDLVSNEFRDFVQTCVKKVDSPEALQVWRQYFECIIGFYKMKCQKS